MANNIPVESLKVGDVVTYTYNDGVSEHNSRFVCCITIATSKVIEFDDLLRISGREMMSDGVEVVFKGTDGYVFHEVIANTLTNGEIDVEELLKLRPELFI